MFIYVKLQYLIRIEIWKSLEPMYCILTKKMDLILQENVITILWNPKSLTVKEELSKSSILPLRLQEIIMTMPNSLLTQLQPIL